jgi:hypothetical protein
VTIDAEGLVGASVRGRRVVVRGSVRGDLLGHEAVVLEDGARVVGDVRAPSIAIATGAMVRGFVETGEAADAVPKGARAQPAARPVARPAAAAPRPVAVAPAVASPPPVVIAKPVAAPAPAVQASATGSGDAHASNGPRRPPPPVVPSLKKAKGQIAKKKER